MSKEITPEQQAIWKEHAKWREQSKFQGLVNQFIKLQINKETFSVGDQIHSPYGEAIVVKIVEDPKPLVDKSGDVTIPDIYVLVEDNFARHQQYKIVMCESFRCSLHKKSTTTATPF